MRKIRQKKLRGVAIGEMLRYRRDYLILQLKEEGFRDSELGQIFGISTVSIWKILKKFKVQDSLRDLQTLKELKENSTYETKKALDFVEFLEARKEKRMVKV